MPTPTAHRPSQAESVLAYHGPLIYEAEITETVEKSAPNGKNIRLHQLHYSGWNSHWDEWVPESRLLKKSEANLEMQKERVKEFQRAHKRKAKADAAAGGSTGGGKKQKAEPGGADKGDAKGDEWCCADIREQLRLPHVSLVPRPSVPPPPRTHARTAWHARLRPPHLGQGMKLKLIEDWEWITREKKLVPLPLKTTPTVNALLEDFKEAKARKTTHERLYSEMCDGVRSYFNQALGSILLYKYERRQHRDFKEGEKALAPADIYGAEHLLRLFVKLPELLAQVASQPTSRVQTPPPHTQVFPVHVIAPPVRSVRCSASTCRCCSRSSPSCSSSCRRTRRGTLCRSTRRPMTTTCTGGPTSRRTIDELGGDAPGWTTRRPLTTARPVAPGLARAEGAGSAPFLMSNSVVRLVCV